jgi:hypothetical protein
LRRLNLELATLVTQESPVLKPQDLDAVQIVQKLRYVLGLLVVVYFERDLACGRVSADVDRVYLSDQTIPLGYAPGDPGELARAVRLPDTVSVVERHKATS